MVAQCFQGLEDLNGDVLVFSSGFLNIILNILQNASENLILLLIRVHLLQIQLRLLQRFRQMQGTLLGFHIKRLFVQILEGFAILLQSGEIHGFSRFVLKDAKLLVKVTLLFAVSLVKVLFINFLSHFLCIFGVLIHFFPGFGDDSGI
jgi:hypothetical protein